MNNNFHILVLLLFICRNALAPTIGASSQSPSQGLLMAGGAFSTDLAPSIPASGQRPSQGFRIGGRACRACRCPVDRAVLRTFSVQRREFSGETLN